MKITDFKTIKDITDEFGNKFTHFTRYYKYNFYYEYEGGGHGADVKISIKIGGQSSDIYRWDMAEYEAISDLIGDKGWDAEYQCVTLTINGAEKEFNEL